MLYLKIESCHFPAKKYQYYTKVHSFCERRLLIEEALFFTRY
ncbi:hypothetical protein NY10_1868 [Carnobacterium antarcticum]|nr:hypothetical protein NY10_1868 [Carnobacterium sp. CP1]